MQRLVSLKLASNLTRKLPHSTTTTTSSLFLSHFQKPFASLTKPAQTQTQTHFFAHSWRSHTSLSAEIHGFLANPLLAKRLFDCSSNTLLRKSLADFRVGFRGGQFPNPSFRSFQQRSGWRSWLRGLSPHDVIISLIVANVTIFLLWRLVDPRFMYKNFTISVENFKSGRLHTLITSAFSHIDIDHILHNMIGLYFFGVHLGQVFGPEFLLKLYLAGGIAGSVFYLAHSVFLASSSKGQFWKDSLRTPALGASGAVNAIILLDIFLFPKSTLYLNFFIPIPAILLGIYLIGKDVLGMIEGDTPGSAHLGGGVVAAVAWARLRRGRF